MILIMYVYLYTAQHYIIHNLFLFFSLFYIYNTTGGHVGIADFFLRGNYDDTLTPLFRTLRSAESTFHKGWFSMDHVHLLSDEQLDDFEGLDVVWDNRFRGAIPFLPFLQPFHGVYIMKKK